MQAWLRKRLAPLLAYWQNDAIQVCAQGLLLEEEQAVPVPRGILLSDRGPVEAPTSVATTSARPAITTVIGL
jgi:hypothetical protein